MPAGCLRILTDGYFFGTITELLGQSLFQIWQKLCLAIDEKYDMERLWNTGGKNWTYEYKYRRGGKTLCCLPKGYISKEAAKIWNFIS